MEPGDLLIGAGRHNVINDDSIPESCGLTGAAKHEPVSRAVSVTSGHDSSLWRLSNQPGRVRAGSEVTSLSDAGFVLQRCRSPSSTQSGNEAGHSRLPRRRAARRMQNRPQRRHCILEHIIYHDVVEFGPMADFLAR